MKSIYAIFPLVLLAGCNTLNFGWKEGPLVDACQVLPASRISKATGHPIDTPQSNTMMDHVQLSFCTYTLSGQENKQLVFLIKDYSRLDNNYHTKLSRVEDSRTCTQNNMRDGNFKNCNGQADQYDFEIIAPSELLTNEEANKLIDEVSSTLSKIN